MFTSGIIEETENTDKIEILDTESSTAFTYRRSIGGKLYFMKKLRPEFYNDVCYRDAFFKEYDAGKKIISPYIVEYYGIKDDADGLYILMEYIQGRTLKEKIGKEPEYFTKSNIKKFLLQLCKALKTLHSNNIVHLDISPNNILFAQASNDIKIIDLGFCLSNYNNNTRGHTAGFSAPEAQSSDAKEINASSDIYSIGALLEYIEKNSGTSLPRYAKKIKERCLQPQKEKRYQSVEEIINVLRYATVKRVAVIATIIAVATSLLVPYAIQAYNACKNYIAWETGQIPEKFEENGVFYRITDHDARTVEITYKGKDYNEFEYEYSGVVVFPARVTHRGRTFKVTAFAEDALSVNTIRSIKIENGIDSIGNFALSRNPFEGTLFIPASVKWIGKGVLDNCTYLEKVEVDAGNPYYDSREGCNAIIETATNTLIAGCCTSKIPQGNTKIADHAFAGQLRLGSINIPESVTYIGDYAFHSCPFYRITLPQGLTHIGDYAFQWCEKLIEIEIPENVTYIGEAALSNCGYSTLVIPDKVTYIGAWAFDKCPNLATVTIGESVASIGVFAFDGCGKLTKIVSRIPADKLFAVDGSTFGSVAGNCPLYVPRGAKATYQNTNGWNHFVKIVETDL